MISTILNIEFDFMLLEIIYYGIMHYISEALKLIINPRTFANDVHFLEGILKQISTS